MADNPPETKGPTWDEIVQRGPGALDVAVRRGVMGVIELLEKLGNKPPPRYAQKLLSPEQFDEMLAGQAGVCAICKENPDDVRLAVDHIRGTEKVRGILCRKCNLGLGHFNHDPGRLRAAAEYIERAGG